MRKESVEQNMKVIEYKKDKLNRMNSRLGALEVLKSAESVSSPSGSFAHLSNILKDIDLKDKAVKNAIVNLALERFLKKRKPINQSFLKFLSYFDKFDVCSLLCAYSYMESAKISSRGDIKTFIYIFFGFNMLSTKYLDDYSVWNTSYIKFWGITRSQAHQLEIFALKKLRYDMEIDFKFVEKTIFELFKE